MYLYLKRVFPASGKIERSHHDAAPLNASVMGGRRCERTCLIEEPRLSKGLLGKSSLDYPRERGQGRGSNIMFENVVIYC